MRQFVPNFPSYVSISMVYSWESYHNSVIGLTSSESEISQFIVMKFCSRAREK